MGVANLLRAFVDSSKVRRSVVEEEVPEVRRREREVEQRGVVEQGEERKRSEEIWRSMAVILKLEGRRT